MHLSTLLFSLLAQATQGAAGALIPSPSTSVTWGNITWLLSIAGLLGGLAHLTSFLCAVVRATFALGAHRVCCSASIRVLPRIGLGSSQT